MVNELVSLALDDCLPVDYPYVRGVSNMKVKSTFYTRKTGADFDPVIHIRYPKSRADELSYTSTAKLVDQMFRTGQMVMAAKNQFDFPDGKDDGRDVPFDRLRGLDYPEVSQALAETEQKLKEHEENVKAMATKESKKKAEGASSASESSDGGSAADDGAN